MRHYFSKAKGVPARHYMCKSCHAKWAQAGGYCRQCIAEYEIEVVPQRRMTHYVAPTVPATQWVPAADREPRPPKPITIGHRTYFVMWDGA